MRMQRKVERIIVNSVVVPVQKEDKIGGGALQGESKQPVGEGADRSFSLNRDVGTCQTICILQI
eukprot:394135-Ditylum_brightwellii.AAC.1